MSAITITITTQTKTRVDSSWTSTTAKVEIPLGSEDAILGSGDAMQLQPAMPTPASQAPHVPDTSPVVVEGGDNSDIDMDMPEADALFPGESHDVVPNLDIDPEQLADFPLTRTDSGLNIAVPLSPVALRRGAQHLGIPSFVVALGEASCFRAKQQRCGNVPAGIYTDLQKCAAVLKCEANELCRLGFADDLFSATHGSAEAASASDVPHLTKAATAEVAAAVQHLVAAVLAVGPRAGEAKRMVSYLLGSWLLWRSLEVEGRGPDDFQHVASLCTRHLHQAAVRIEATFVAESLGGLFASFPTGTILPEQDLRQDDHGGVPLDPSVLHSEGMARMVLLILGHSVDQGFQNASAHAMAAIEGSTIQHAAVKGRNRCWLKATTDYCVDRPPTDARNVDMVRNAVTFPTPEAMRAGFDSLVCAFGQPLRVKNNMQPDYQAIEGSLGYRSIIATFRYEPAGVAWGTLLDRMAPETWSKLETECDQIWEFWPQVQMYVEEDAFRASQVSMCVEVQLILRAYLDYRRTSHFPYKVQRVSNWAALHTEFAACAGKQGMLRAISKTLGLLALKKRVLSRQTPRTGTCANADGTMDAGTGVCTDAEASKGAAPT